jgi:hypothetical protein
MPSYQQQKLLASLLQRSEAILDKAIAEWQMLPHDVLAAKPAPGKWSANECLQHLNNYGRYYLPAINKAMKVSPSAAAEQFHSGWLGNYFTRIMQPGSDGKLPMKMKSPQDYAPKTIVESHLVIAEFIEQQERLLKLLDAASHVDFNKVKVGISIAPIIKLKLGDVFMFLIAHEERHVQQAGRAVEGGKK